MSVKNSDLQNAQGDILGYLLNVQVVWPNHGPTETEVVGGQEGSPCSCYHRLEEYLGRSQLLILLKADETISSQERSWLF